MRCAQDSLAHSEQAAIHSPVLNSIQGLWIGLETYFNFCPVTLMQILSVDSKFASIRANTPNISLGFLISAYDESVGPRVKYPTTEECVKKSSPPQRGWHI